MTSSFCTWCAGARAYVRLSLSGLPRANFLALYPLELVPHLEECAYKPIEDVAGRLQTSRVSRSFRL